MEFKIEGNADNCFVPNSLLSELRRDCVERFDRQWNVAYQASRHSKANNEPTPTYYWQPEYKSFPYLYNIANAEARAFYERNGLSHPAPAFECDNQAAASHPLIMQCRHCIRYALGYCTKRGGQRPTWREPLTLRLGDGRRFKLEFKCNECQMNIYAE